MLNPITAPRRAWLRACACATALALLSATATAAAPKAPPPELPAETLVDGGSIAPEHGERVYVIDFAISHITDGRIRVFDARSGRFLGMVSTAYAGNFALSEKRDALYVATTHMSRSTRGERVDVLEVHGTADLGFQYEVVLPPKRAQALNYRGLVRGNSDGRFVYVQNATPGSSVTVVDLAQRKVVSEIPTAGCWGVLPAASHATRFSTLCGDGKMLTITLDEQGQVAERQTSEKLFDADLDAWFHHAEQVGDRYWYVSFQGVLTELNLGGPVASVQATRALVDAAGRKAGWRPGGYQVFAVDPAARWLVVGMHDKGSEGSHKRPAKQLWVVDLANGKRVAAVPGHGAAALTFSRTGQRLNVVDGERGALRTFAFADGKMKPMATVLKAGEAPLHIESHD